MFCFFKQTNISITNNEYRLTAVLPKYLNGIQRHYSTQQNQAKNNQTSANIYTEITFMEL